MNPRNCLMAAAALSVAACGGGGPDSVNQAPQIAGLADVTVSANRTSMPLAITVADDQDTSALTLSASSGNPPVLPDNGLSIGGAGETRTLTVTPVRGRLGAARVTVTAVDAGGASVSAELTVTVAAEDVSFTTFLRNTFARAGNSEPRDLNSRRFRQDAGDGDFDDLLGNP